MPDMENYSALIDTLNVVPVKRGDDQELVYRTISMQLFDKLQQFYRTVTGRVNYNDEMRSLNRMAYNLLNRMVMQYVIATRDERHTFTSHTPSNDCAILQSTRNSLFDHYWLRSHFLNYKPGALELEKPLYVTIIEAPDNIRNSVEKLEELLLLQPSMQHMAPELYTLYNINGSNNLKLYQYYNSTNQGLEQLYLLPRKATPRDVILMTMTLKEGFALREPAIEWPQAINEMAAFCLNFPDATPGSTELNELYAEFEKICDELYDKTYRDMATAYRDFKLVETFKRMKTARLDTLRNNQSNAYSQMKNREDTLNATIETYNQICAELFYEENGKGRDYDSLLKAVHKRPYIVNVRTVATDTVEFTARTYATNYEITFMKRLLEHGSWRPQYFTRATQVDVLKRIFIDQTHYFVFESRYNVNIARDRVDGVSELERAPYVHNPHVTHFDCFSAAKISMQKAFRDANYETFLDIMGYCNSSFNPTDGTVMTQLKDTIKSRWAYIKVYDVATKELISLTELEANLIKEREVNETDPRPAER